jgi:hypothetical protein
VVITLEIPFADRIANHVRAHKTEYLVAGVAGITFLIMRGRNAGVLRVLDGSDGITVRPLTLLSNKTNVVTLIGRDTQGPPSWVVRCLETGDFFVSQADAAKSMNIPASVLSTHLNGKFEDALGLHFERICLAAN